MSVDRILIDDPGGPASEDERDAALKWFRQSFSNRLKNPRQKANRFLDDIKSDNWKVLFFTKDGRTVRSRNALDSEQQAEEVGHACEKLIRRDVFGIYQGEDGIFQGIEYSHFMVIPWNKK